MIQGVDISRYQSDYQPRPQDAFVIVKATEGRTSANPYHDAQVDRCRRAGKIIGHYHWMWPGNVEAQLDWFTAKARLRVGDIIALDWENDPFNDNGQQVPKADMEAWCRAAKARFPDNRVLIYTFPRYGPFVATKGNFYQADGLWIADYRDSSRERGAPQDIFGLDWLIWQYTDDPFDHNRARFDSPAAMRAWANFDQDDLGFDPAEVWKAPIP